MAGKKVKHTQKITDRVPRNWTRRQMILERVESQYMKDQDRRDKRPNENTWKNEDWGGEE